MRRISEMRWRALKSAMPPAGEMGVIGKAIAGRGEFGVALGGGQAAAHGLHRGRPGRPGIRSSARAP